MRERTGASEGPERSGYVNPIRVAVDYPSPGEAEPMRASTAFTGSAGRGARPTPGPEAEPRVGRTGLGGRSTGSYRGRAGRHRGARSSNRASGCWHDQGPHDEQEHRGEDEPDRDARWTVHRVEPVSARSVSARDVARERAISKPPRSCPATRSSPSSSRTRRVATRASCNRSIAC